MLITVSITWCKYGRKTSVSRYILDVLFMMELSIERSSRIHHGYFIIQSDTFSDRCQELSSLFLLHAVFAPSRTSWQHPQAHLCFFLGLCFP